MQEITISNVHGCSTMTDPFSSADDLQKGPKPPEMELEMYSAQPVLLLVGLYSHEWGILIFPLLII